MIDAHTLALVFVLGFAAIVVLVLLALKEIQEYARARMAMRRIADRTQAIDADSNRVA